MSKLNYCDLPSIPCSMRTGNSKSYFPEKSEYCSMFNPDQVSKFINQNPNLNEYNVCYRDYPKEGKIGDYICNLNDDGRCVGRANDCKILDKKKKVQEGYVKIDPSSEIYCMPPDVKNCKSQENEKKDAELYINGKAFYKCQNNDPMCISDVYSADKMGLPVSQNYADPIQRKILYTQNYDEPILNKKIVSCPDGYNVCDEDMCCWKNKKCIPAEKRMVGSQYPFCEYGEGVQNLYVDNYPKIGEFQTEKECLDWCANNPDCKTVVKFLDRSGNLQCRYYKYDSKDNRIKQVRDKTAVIYNKRQNKYVPNPILPLKQNN